MPDLDVLIIGGNAHREELGREERSRMRLSVAGIPATLRVLAAWFASDRDPVAARTAFLDPAEAFVSLNGPYLQQFLEGQGLNVTLLPMLADHEQELTDLLARRPKVVAISTTFIPFAAEIDSIAARIKAVAPQALVVAGGPQVWKSYRHRLLADQGGIGADILPAVAEHNYLVDPARPSPVDALVVSNRGEHALAALTQRLKAGAAWEDLDNLALHRDGAWRLSRIVEEPYREIRVDWSRALPPDFRGFVPVQAGQGCPFRCRFCDFCGMFPTVTARSPQSLLDEIATIVPHDGRRRVYFTDDNLFPDRRRAKEILRTIRASGLALRWRGLIRLPVVDDEVAELMAATGCAEVLLGIESGDPALLTAMGKASTPEAILAKLGILHRHGISTKSTFIIGFPGETAASVQRTVDLINAYPADGRAVHRWLGFTFAVLPLSQVASAASRAEHQLVGYGWKWRHRSMDSTQAAALLDGLFARIKPEIAPSYPQEAPELPGLTAAGIQRIYTLRNRLARQDDPALWAELAGVFGDGPIPA